MVDRPPYWLTTAQRLILDYWPYARIYEEDICLPDGTEIKNWVKLEQPAFVIVFPVTTEGQVALIRQYRYGLHDWSIELPSGHIEDGEESLAAAQRECWEEAGLSSGMWQFLGKYIMDVNRICGWGYVYLAQDLSGHQQADGHDLGDMTVLTWSLEEVEQRWSKGEIQSAPSTLTIGLALHALKQTRT